MNFRANRSFSRPARSLALLSLIGLLTVLAISACGGNQPNPVSTTPTLTLTPTFPPTLTPTPMPLGSQANPFIIGIVSEAVDPEVDKAAAELAARIGEISSQSVIAQVYPSYSQLMDALAEKKVHATWLPPLTYLYASQFDLAEVVLITNHFGVYGYGTQFLANIKSGFTPYYDPISGLSSADAPTALEQFRGKRPCYVEPQSPSGYIVPAGLLRVNDITTPPGALIQSHPAIIRALYIQGICDFGATFSISGDPRTSSEVQKDLPDVMSRILIIWRTDAIIPNLNLSVNAKLSEADRQTLTNAFLELGKTPEGRDLLTRSASGYQVEEIKPASDDLYDPLREVSKALDLNLKDLLGK